MHRNRKCFNNDNGTFKHVINILIHMIIMTMPRILLFESNVIFLSYEFKLKGANLFIGFKHFYI